MNRATQKPLPMTRRGLAAMCALAVWLLGVFGSSAELHGALHSDATHAGHTCAITLFNHGVEESVAGRDLVVGPLDFSVEKQTVAAEVAIAQVNHRYPPGCGPPRC